MKSPRAEKRQSIQKTNYTHEVKWIRQLRHSNNGVAYQEFKPLKMIFTK